MKKLSLIFVSLLMACSEDTLRPVCPLECWPDSMHESRKGVGACVSGIPVCDEGNRLVDCDYSEVESIGVDVCDGIDNDCNGAVDDGYYPRTSSRWDYDDDNPCVSVHGVCRNAEIVCRDGGFECIYPDTYESGSETSCDGRDNDCDARVDEDLGDEELCYDAEFWTATNGDCQPGVVRCIQGNWTCDGQKLPSPELCDQVDNDCNGIVDDTGETLQQEYDIVFIIDTSGSMCGEISAVAAALDAYVEQFEGNTNYRFSIVVMSAYGDSHVLLLTDFTDLATVRDQLLLLQCNGSGQEASLDAMYQVCDETDPLGLDWRESATRLFFAFTDEEPQTYASVSTTDTMVVDACLQSQTLPFVWYSAGGTRFPSIVTQANGGWFGLTSDWVQIFEDLNSIIVTLCGG